MSLTVSLGQVRGVQVPALAWTGRAAGPGEGL